MKVLCREARLISKKEIMKKSQCELTVCINGKPVREYANEGRAYVEAKPGSTYSLKFKNNTWGRILAVFSVDGIDVLKGKSASDADTGYVISAQSTVEIKGFRIDNDKEASFKFFEKGNGNGYAEFKGDASSSGVIGVRVFSEKEKPVVVKTVFVDRPVFIDRPVYTDPYPRPYWRSGISYDNATYSSATGGHEGTACCDFMSVDDTVRGGSSTPTKGGTTTRSAVPLSARTKSLMSFSSPVIPQETPKGFDMTTGWGDTVESKVTTTVFEKGTLIEQIEILYASRESLVQMGIKLDNALQILIPSAFDKKLEFCSPPTGWKG